MFGKSIIYKSHGRRIIGRSYDRKRIFTNNFQEEAGSKKAMIKEALKEILAEGEKEKEIINDEGAALSEDQISI